MNLDVGMDAVFGMNLGGLHGMIVGSELVGFSTVAAWGAVEGDGETEKTWSCLCRHDCF